MSWEWALVPVVGFIALALLRFGAKAMALAVIYELEQRLDVDDLKADVAQIKSEVAEIKGEVTLNGGGSMKDMVLETHRQLEAILTDGR